MSPDNESFTIINTPKKEENNITHTGTLPPLPETDITHEIKEIGTDDGSNIFGYLYDHVITDEIQRPVSFDMAIELISIKAEDEVFEDGVIGVFSNSLIDFISLYENIAIDALRNLIFSKKINSEVASEALRWVGYINQKSTIRSRTHLLTLGLFNEAPQIRDGALLGLSYLKDPSILPILINAFDREAVTDLKNDMGTLISYLKGKT